MSITAQHEDLIEAPDIKPALAEVDKLYTQIRKAQQDVARFVCKRCKKRTPVSELTQTMRSVDSGCRDGTYDNNRIYIDYYSVTCPRCNTKYEGKADVAFPFISIKKGEV